MNILYDKVIILINCLNSSFDLILFNFKEFKMIILIINITFLISHCRIIRFVFY
jgi:hypothetical protein